MSAVYTSKDPIRSTDEDLDEMSDYLESEEKQERLEQAQQKEQANG